MLEPATVEAHGMEAGPSTADASMHQAGTEVHGGAEAHANPTGLGLDATQWVALAMLAVIAIMLWKKVPAAIGASLDTKIAAIRAHLDAATKLRQEAEALKTEYEARAAQAVKDANSIREHAQAEAAALTAQAKLDAEALIARRTRMAEDKIAAAERAAIAQVREHAAALAVKTAAQIIASKHDIAADQPLVDQTIAGIGPRSFNS